MEKVHKTKNDLLTSAGSLKVHKNGKWKLQNYKISDNMKEIKQRCTEQLKLALSILGTYKREMKKLKDVERSLAKELTAKGANPEDPDFDAKKVFSIAPKRQPKAQICSDIKKKSTKIEHSGTSKGHKNLKNHLLGKSRKEVSLCDNSIVSPELVEGIPLRETKHELDVLFARDLSNEHEMDSDAPYVPQSIAQVFLCPTQLVYVSFCLIRYDCYMLCAYYLIAVSYTHLTLPTICSV
eukprot:TRINITY_DN2651_c0_g1_i17.p1 TRINITY_DN2651_c0_g1~~TRINITY_DN2651_c0_g1_i17.p1  ORF type:complete len:279 (+),score=72.04 TRINITY_DN2651_c0_g1_i17:126-839(+)